MIKLKTIRWVVLLSAGLVGTGCSTASRTSSYDRALSRAFDELSSKTDRVPASKPSPARSAAFQSLRARVEVLVFPKISNQASMTGEPAMREFSSPIRFAVTAQRLLNCRQLLQERSNHWAHREYFPSEIAPSLDCGVLELKQIAPEVKAGNRKFGDPLSARVYLDSNFHAHGLDIELYRSRGNSETTRIRLDPTEPLSSGLTLFPIDIPNLDAVAAQNGSLPIPDDSYVQAKIRKFRASSCADARRYQYRDAYGNRNTVAWCEGAGWPTVIDNPRFFAITVRK